MLMQIVDNAVDWNVLYDEIAARGDIPFASSESIGDVDATFQSMYLDLAEIKTTLRDAGVTPLRVTIYADVLNIPENTTWATEDLLLVYARRIQAGPRVKVHLDYRTRQARSFVMYCSELEGRFDVVATTLGKDGAADPHVFAIDAPPPTGGTQVRLENGAPVRLARTYAQGITSPPAEVFGYALTTEFIYATLLYEDHPQIALGQLAWLKSWSGASRDLQGMLFRSSSLLALLGSQINARANGAAFVPYLTSAVYKDLATVFTEEAERYERGLRELTTQKVVTDGFISTAKALLDNKTYESDYAAKVRAQAKSNYENAAAAVKGAAADFERAKATASLVAIDFEEVGIPDWERAKIAEAVITCGTAVITFGVGIASMFVGNEAGGAAAAGKAVADVGRVAQTVGKIAEIAKTLKEVMEQLEKLVESLRKVYEMSSLVVESAESFEKAESYARELDAMEAETRGTDVSAAFAWQVYQLNADASLEQPIEMGVQYARELRVAVDAIAIYGQALAAAQVAAVRAGQSYAQAAWQYELAHREQERLALQVASLQAGEAPIVAMMHTFYLRYIDAKSSLFTAVEGYRGSYFYWALQHSSIQPNIIDDVAEIDTGLRDLTAIALDRASALQHFSPPPQRLTSKRVVIDDPAVLAELRTAGKAGWTLDLGTETFEGFDRTRLTRVQVWLEGAKPGAKGRVDIKMSTLGSYLDRFERTNYQFTSDPLEREFVYRVSSKLEFPPPEWTFEDGTYGYIEVDGIVDDEVSYAYFEPTPFAQWRIDLTAHNPGLDLSGVTRVTMVFAGSVIPTTRAAAARLAEG